MSETEQEQTEQTTPEETPTPLQPTEEEQEAEEQEAQESEQVEGGPEQAQASAPVGAVGERELEKMFKRVETANSAYLKKLEGIMEAEISVLEPCPRCSDPFLGLIFPPLMRPATAEVKAAVLASVGETVSEVTETDPYSRRCDVCDGRGRTLSGSRLNRERTLPCKRCKAKGWIAVGPERESESAAVTTPVAVADNGAPAEPAPDADPWGRTSGDPDYGRLPQYVGQA